MYEYHLTLCECCNQVVSISDGDTDKIKLIIGEWADFRHIHGRDFYRIYPRDWEKITIP